jgi:hypothetical protein
MKSCLTLPPRILSHFYFLYHSLFIIIKLVKIFLYSCVNSKESTLSFLNTNMYKETLLVVDSLGDFPNGFANL